MTMHALEPFLDPDPRDAGCGETMRLLHVYADAIADGEDPELRHPGIAAHLRHCMPCAQDLEALLAAIRGR
jgi:hypothetical protein